jgi:uncharacterized lipoprotein YajG
MKRVVLLTAVLILTACTTPTTTLKHPKTKQAVSCGGDVTASMAGGAIGYNIQKDNDAKCVNTYKKQGFRVVE